MKRFFYIALFVLSSQAFASLSLSGPFTWDGSGEYKLNVSDGVSTVAFHGNLRPDSATRPPVETVGRIHVYLKAYNHDLVSVALSQDDDDVGYIFILEAQNNGFVSLNDDQPILARKALMISDLDSIVINMRGKGYGDASALEALAKFFKPFPNKKLSVYAHQFAIGLIKGPAEPKVAKRQDPEPDQEQTPAPDETPAPKRRVRTPRAPEPDPNVDPDQQQQYTPPAPGEMPDPREVAPPAQDDPYGVGAAELRRRQWIEQQQADRAAQMGYPARRRGQDPRYGYPQQQPQPYQGYGYPPGYYQGY